jgi:hypothetical protein
VSGIISFDNRKIQYIFRVSLGEAKKIDPKIFFQGHLKKISRSIFLFSNNPSKIYI